MHDTASSSIPPANRAVHDERPQLYQRSGRPGSEQTQRRFRHRTEFMREKDVFRHLQPWEDTYKPKYLRRIAFPQAGESGETLVESCPDTALAAFAQLCTLRLHARRCLVTLLATETEYVLADVTRSMSLQYDGVVNDPRDRTWIGTCSFRRSEGVSNLAVDEWRKARQVRDLPTQEDHYYTASLSQHWAIFGDVRQSSTCLQLPFFKHGASARFCVSVPLRGAQGSVIGAVTLLDDKPRYGVSATDMAFLEDISDTIVEHLDATAVRSQRQRGERLIQGLGLFNQGKATLRDWWLSQDDAQGFSTGRHTVTRGAQERQARVDAEFGVQADASKEELAEEDPSGKGLQITGNESFARQIGVDSGQQKSSNPLSGNDLPSPEQRTAKQATRPRRPGPKKRIGSIDPATSFADAYARASNLLREAMGADGVVIVNASHAPGILKRHASDVTDSDAAVSRSSSSETSGKQASDGDGSDSGSAGAKLCKLHGFSTRARSSLGGFRAETQSFPLSEAHLHRLIKRYPGGFVVHFDAKGGSHVSSDEDSEPSSTDEPESKRRRKHKDAQLISRAMKGARTVALLPLWDDSKARWSSCVFAWSESSDRYFDKEESLTYLTAFGHSLMAEVSRLESLADGKAKGTFISSISHELRSPLHGIMAGVEFLQGSDLTSFQDEMAHAISMAARTLLDTINHILDYSKISNLSRKQKTPYGGTIEKVPSLTPSSEKDISLGTDIARLTEEVVETTVAAHRSQYNTPLSPHGVGSPPRRLSMQRIATSFTPVSLQCNNVSVTLNIDYRENWVAEIQPGAWTRILTNILGNALKYTAEGHISIRLAAGKPIVKGESSVTPVKLTVEDTGIGISEEFQSSGLFMPFKQDDPHSTGTGLGLSIVNQIAREMGADLNLKSKQGKGTRITLSLLANFIVDDNTKESVSAIDPIPEHLTVEQFHLLGFGADDISDGSSAKRDVGDSVLELAHQWLQCKAIRGPKIAPVEGNSVCAVTERQLTTLENESPERLSRLLNEAAKQHSHILVFGESMDSLSLSTKITSPVLTPVFVHQPIGPRKLLRAIAYDRDSISNAEHNRRSSPFAPNDGLQRLSRPATLSRSASKAEATNPSPLGVPGHAEGSSATESSLTSARQDASSDASGPTITSSDPTEPAPSSQILATDEGGSQGDTVLLVEDNEINMRLLVALMKKLKLKFQCANHGGEALDLYRDTPGEFFLVLMDMSMPVMDGFTSTARIREFEKKKRLKRTTIVALTGVTNHEARTRAFDSGVDEYYTKPVQMKELKELVDGIQGRD